MDNAKYRELRELLVDADKSPRVTDFERAVLETIRRGLDTYGEDVEFSDKQWRIVREIERKVYAVG